LPCKLDRSPRIKHSLWYYHETTVDIRCFPPIPCFCGLGKEHPKRGRQTWAGLPAVLNAALVLERGDGRLKALALHRNFCPDDQIHICSVSRKPSHPLCRGFKISNSSKPGMESCNSPHLRFAPKSKLQGCLSYEQGNRSISNHPHIVFPNPVIAAKNQNQHGRRAAFHPGGFETQSNHFQHRGRSLRVSLSEVE